MNLFYKWNYSYLGRICWSSNAVCFADLSNEVICVKDVNKLNEINNGIYPIYELELSEMLQKI